MGAVVAQITRETNISKIAASLHNMNPQVHWVSLVILRYGISQLRWGSLLKKCGDELWENLIRAMNPHISDDATTDIAVDVSLGLLMSGQKQLLSDACSCGEKLVKCLCQLMSSKANDGNVFMCLLCLRQFEDMKQKVDSVAPQVVKWFDQQPLEAFQISQKSVFFPCDKDGMKQFSVPIVQQALRGAVVLLGCIEMEAHILSTLMTKGEMLRDLENIDLSLIPDPSYTDHPDSELSESSLRKGMRELNRKMGLRLCGFSKCESTENSATGKFKLCSACKSIYYCCKECQKADWKAGHKKTCAY